MDKMKRKHKRNNLPRKIKAIGRIKKICRKNINIRIKRQQEVKKNIERNLNVEIKTIETFKEIKETIKQKYKQQKKGKEKKTH